MKPSCGGDRNSVFVAMIACVADGGAGSDVVVTSIASDVDTTQHSADVSSTITFTPNTSTEAQHLILDGSTIVNLDLLSNSADGSRKGSLLDTLDRCVTAQGKRMFAQWMCAPLCSVPDINARYDNVLPIRVCTCVLLAVCLVLCDACQAVSSGELDRELEQHCA